MANIPKKIQEAGMILGGLGVIGFIGIIWMMIYGNLSGNLGIPKDSLTTLNETGFINSSGYPLAKSTNVGFSNPSILAAVNRSNGALITSGNFTLNTITGRITNKTAVIWTNVSFNYTNQQDSTIKIQAEGVISNQTSGFNTFFSFSGTFFTVAAIVLLIFMFIGLLAIVISITRAYGGGSRNGFT